MIGYVTLGTNDLPRAATFYDAIAKHFGVGRWVIQFARAIARLRDNTIRPRNDRANRHFTPIPGGARLSKGSVHVCCETHRPFFADAAGLCKGQAPPAGVVLAK